VPSANILWVSSEVTRHDVMQTTGWGTTTCDRTQMHVIILQCELQINAHALLTQRVLLHHRA
jgi:hypothetical protein